MTRHERPPRTAAAVRDRDPLEAEPEARCTRVCRRSSSLPWRSAPSARMSHAGGRGRSRPDRPPRRATSPDVRPSRGPRACARRPKATPSSTGMNCGCSTSPRDLRVDHRIRPFHRRDPGLDPRVLAVRALTRAADADPARDVPGLDAGCTRHRDRRAHAVPPIRRLVAGVRVATRLDVADAAHGRQTLSWTRRRARRVSTRRRGLRGGAALARVCRRRLLSVLRSLVLAIRSRVGPRQACLQCGAMATTEDRGAAESLDAWRANVYDSAPERTDELFSTISGIENEPLSTPGERRRRLRTRPRLPGRIPVHARRLPVDVSRTALDDAPVRRLRHGRRRRTSASATSRSTGRRASRRPSTCRRSWATTPTTRARSARSVAKASRSTRSPTWRRSSAASRSATSRPR